MYMKLTELTQTQGHAMRSRVGRKKRWHENLNLPLPAGAKDRMDAMLGDGENRLDLIRDAIEKELKRRERQKNSKATDSKSSED